MKQTLVCIVFATLLFGCTKQDPVVISTPLDRPPTPVNTLDKVFLLGSWRNDGFYKNLPVSFTADTMLLWGYVYPYYISTDTVFSSPNPLWKYHIIDAKTITLLPISPNPSHRPPDTFYRVK